MNGAILIGEEFAEPIEELSDTQAGVLFKAVLRYGTDQELPETDDQSVTILFMLLKGYIDRMEKKYEERCQKNRKNGQLGGRPSKTERIDEKPNGLSENPKNPIQNQNQNQIQNQNQNQNQIQNHDHSSPDGEEKRELKLPKRAALPDGLDQDFVQEAFRDFREMRSKMKKPMTARAEELIIKDLAKLAKGDSVTAVKIIEQSIKNGWQGLFPLKERADGQNINERLKAL